jgi:uncharacterized protein with LGFP repeats
VFSSPADGTHLVRNSLLPGYQQAGWENGILGYPVTDTMCGILGGGCFQQFVGGSIYYHSSTGAHPVSGLIYDKWASMQWEYGPLGYPIGPPTAVTDGFTQRFQRGILTSNTSTGVVVVS